MLARLDLQKLAALRLKEAEALHAAGLYDGSVYLCGYVVELALKACICKTLNISDYPDTEGNLRDFKTHDFQTLILLAGLRTEMTAARAADPKFDANYTLAFGWKPDLRYKVGEASESDSRAQLDALRASEGVLSWLSKRW